MEQLYDKAIIYLSLFVRISVFIHLIPQLRSYITLPTRVIITASLALPAFGFANVVATSELTLFLLQVLYGACLALPVALVLYLPPYVGRLVDSYRGAQFGELVAPGSGEKVTPLEQFGDLASLLIVSFFVTQSQILTMLISPSASEMTEVNQQWIVSTILIFGDVLILGFYFATPVLLASLLIDLSAGLIGKFVKRVNLTFELMPLKLVLALCLLIVSCRATDLLNIEQQLVTSLNGSAQLSGSIFKIILMAVSSG